LSGEIMKQSGEEATGSYDSAEENLVAAKYCLNNDMDKEAEQYLLKALELDGQSAAAHNQLGAVYFGRSEYGRAEYHFKKALQLDFKMTEAHFNLGFLYQMQGKFKEALPYYKEVVISDPDDPEVYCLMGQCALSAEMFQEAESFLLESFRLDPAPETATDLTILYIAEEKYPEAEEMLNFLLDLSDKFPDAQRSHDHDSRQITKSKALEKLDRGGTPIEPFCSDPRVRGDFQKLETSAPRSVISLFSNPLHHLDRASLGFTMGLVLERQGKYMDAIKHLREVVMMDEQHEQAFNYLGECCVAIGMEKEAESFFAKASKLDPEYLRPIMNLGKLYYKREEFYRTVVETEHYLKVRGELMNALGQELEKTHDPEVELVYEIMGRAYMQLGDKAKATEVWEKSLEINPDQPKILSLMKASSPPAYRKTALSIDDSRS